ncbi:pentatricopeptide repeat-containing protein At1g80270, mitochondrial-like [Primulina tabacum]|uniref:pentatricopeptide repeat-containing protein At1g80270, mitochondrial-like n=1 Tax=Primulina tabacum TaxID=48773 RepID=UPI003F592C92
MWALRRASIHLKNRVFIVRGTQIFFTKSEIASCSLGHYNPVFAESEVLIDGLLSSTKFYSTSSSSKLYMAVHTLSSTKFCSTSSSSKLYTAVHTFSSQAGTESGGENGDDLEDGFSELEGPTDATQEALSGDENIDDQLISEEDSAATYTNNAFLEIGTEVDGGEKKYSKTRATSPMTEAILAAPPLTIHKVLDKWVEEGKEVTRKEVTSTFLHLRKRKLFLKALKLSEWLKSTKHLDFLERDHASHVDFIAKASSIFQADDYINKIPESFRGEHVYRTLLANCVATTHVKKSEEVFNRMKDLKFPLTTFTCNQLLILYKRTNKKKIADVLLLMEKENIKPSLFTYQLLIDVKGLSKDIAGMEQVLETMKAEGLEVDTRIQASLARHYAANGLKNKAEAVLKEMEGENIQKNRWVCKTLLPIYASLRRGDEVDRLWEVCKSNPGLEECMAAIVAWGKLDRIADAEETFEKMLKMLKKPASKHFSVLLKVYMDRKMIEKGKELVRRMAETCPSIWPSTLDSLVRLYIDAGEVEKAEKILDAAHVRNKGRPMFTSFLAVMDQYANRGDIHNAEKIFQKMRQAGYFSRLQPYQSLVRAYTNAKSPAYGFTERMKADNIYPDKVMSNLLTQVDPFRKTEVDELLG